MKLSDFMRYLNKEAFYTSSIGLTFPVIIKDVKSTPYNAGSVSVQIVPAADTGSGAAWVLFNSITLID